MIYYVVWLLVAVLYSPIFYELYHSRWQTLDYTHAYFILPVALWAVWQKRQTLKDLFRNTKLQLSDGIGLAAAVFGLLIFMFGWRQDFTVLSTFSVILVLWGLARYLYGKSVVRALAFPIFFLLFLVPPPFGILDAVTLPMRYGVLTTVEHILKGMGYAVQRNGLLLSMGGHEIFMGAPCSGFRSLITMFALAVGYVYFIKASAFKRWILIPAVLPLALLGNLIRVLGLCFMTYYAGHEAAEGFFHYTSGSLIFLLMIVCLMLLENRLDKYEKKRSSV